MFVAINVYTTFAALIYLHAPNLVHIFYVGSDDL